MLAKPNLRALKQLVPAHAFTEEDGGEDAEEGEEFDDDEVISDDEGEDAEGEEGEEGEGEESDANENDAEEDEETGKADEEDAAPNIKSRVVTGGRSGVSWEDVFNE